MSDDDQGDLFGIDPNDMSLIEQAIDPELRHRWPETLAAMVDVVAAALRGDPRIDDQDADLAAKVVMAQAIYLGGHVLYLPKGNAIENALRDRKLFHAWMNGKGTPTELADVYGVTYARVMQIIREQRGLWRKQYAPELPGLDG